MYNKYVKYNILNKVAVSYIDIYVKKYRKSIYQYELKNALFS